MNRSGRAALAAMAAAVCALALPISPARAEPVRFILPVDCELGRTCVVQNYVDHDPASGARDYQCGTLTYDAHNGTDIRVPDASAMRAGVNVLAAAIGQVVRVRNDMDDSIVPTGRSFTDMARACGNGVVIDHRDGWQTQYCHMAKGSVRVKAREPVASGQPIGQVGVSGNTQFPHLHFTVRHNGKVVDPFAHEPQPGACGSGGSLWRSPGPGFAYQVRTLLNAGFAAEPVTAEKIESGALGRPPNRDAPALVAFVRVIGLQQGDVQRLTVTAPNHALLADSTLPPLDRAKAQNLMFAGKRRPPAGWLAGSYEAHFTVSRDGAVVFERRFAISL
jgi:murein DD-endopeptidase MepM/ murein hydrolase activator NlpD